MFQVKAKTTTVVIGDWVFQVNAPTLIRGELPELVGKHEHLLEIIELDEELLAQVANPAGGGLTADGIDHTGEDASTADGDVDKDTSGEDPLADPSAGTTDPDPDPVVGEDDGGAAPDPFADADELLVPAPAPPVAPPKSQTRTSRGGRR
ncbi:MAG: hypothetical protein Q8O14_14560 [bacterium]|nr:hypothetical protein [bacterium]